MVSKKTIIRIATVLIIVGGLVLGMFWINMNSTKNLPQSEQESNGSPQNNTPHTDDVSQDNNQQTEQQIKEQHNEELIERWIQELTLEEKVGQLFMPQLTMSGGKNTTAMNQQLQSMIQDFHLGGVILFQKNIEGIEQLVTFNDQIQQASRLPLFISIDQEGGLVQRIPSGTNMPGNMALGATGDHNLAYEAGNVIGRELKALGINLNFAPVLDVNNNPNNPVIGIRSFGEDPNLVAKLGVSYIQGLQDADVMATAKHFPGHGDTDVDSHLGLPVLQVDRERLEKIELLPFRQAIEQGVDMIMTAHVTLPRLDNTKMISKKEGTEVNLPATLSYKILTELLREELAFAGVIVTDAFTMKAISDHFGEEEAVMMSIQAGADIILMPTDIDNAYLHVLDEVRHGSLTEERINQSVRRILRLKSQYGLLSEVGQKFNEGQTSLEEKIKFAQQIVGNKDHKQIEANISKQSVTLVKNEDGMLPFTLNQDDRLLILAPTQSSAKSIVSSIQQLQEEKNAEGFTWSGNVDVFVYSQQHSQNPSMAPWQRRLLDQADYVIVVSQNISHKDTDEQIQRNVVQIIDDLNDRSLPYVWMSVERPYDLLIKPDAKAYMAVYGAQSLNLKAGLNVIFGFSSPRGKLPVSIPGTTSEVE